MNTLSDTKPKETKDLDAVEFFLNNLVKIILIFVGLSLFLGRSWVGEDAFIFFKYVDNFVNGNGLVFNLGERVEGFTAPLWVFVLSLLRWLLQIELRPLAIILGLVLSTSAVSLFLIYTSKSKYLFPIAYILLITNSAFRDFATSGFETSLTYLLLILSLIAIDKKHYLYRPFYMGFLLSLLVLNRPESFLLLAYIMFVNVASAYKMRDISLSIAFIVPVLILCGGYQLFRMSYYAALLPNTFYAKKGGTLYIEQGVNYLKDFIFSYPLWTATLLICVIYVCANKKLFLESKHYLAVLILFCSYVLYAGGDYMHGRSLLMAFIVSMFFVSKVVNNWTENIPNYSNLTQFGLLVISTVVLLFGLRQTPITKLAGAQVNNIADERARFGYGAVSGKLKQYISMPITFELGWAERGYYYRELSEKLNLPISVVNTNIGYFGYAAGDLVNVMGGVLTDPYIARQPVATRGKIGHENDPHLDYVYARRPTFAYTPYKYWNENAHYKWKGAMFSYALVDDSNDSFVPIFDLSNKDFLAKFSELIGVDVKADIDAAQRRLLVGLSSESLKQSSFDVVSYLKFLKRYWYPYAESVDQKLFDTKVQQLALTSQLTVEPVEYTDELYFRTTTPLTKNVYLDNIMFALRNR